MRKIFFLFLIYLFNAAAGSAQTVLYTEGFETDGEGTRYVSNTFSFCSGVPGNNPDYFLRTNTNPVLPAGCTIGFTDVLTNLQGSFFWASEDVRSSSPVFNGNPPGQITTQPISISGYGSLVVSLFLATSSNNNVRWETADSINIQVSLDGSAFTTVGRFMGDNIAGGRLRIDANLDGAITAADPATTCDQLNFTKYSFNIPGSGNSIRIRLDYDQIGGTEELAIDQLQLSGTIVLPVKLIYFNAKQQGNNETLFSWQVDDAADLSYFELEKSNDGLNFSSIRKIMPGASTVYSTTDNYFNNLPGYYRLKIAERNGNYTYSQVLALQKKAKGIAIMTISPNPAPETAQLKWSAAEACNGQLTVCNTTGKRLLLLPVTLPAGETLISLPLKNLAAGVYFIQFTDRDGNRLATARLIKK